MLPHQWMGQGNVIMKGCLLHIRVVLTYLKDIWNKMKLITIDNFEKSVIRKLELASSLNEKEELMSLLEDYAWYRSIGGESIE